MEAARQVLTLDRRRVREVFEQRFSATAMARHYLELYRQLPGNRNTEVNFKQTA